MLSVNAGKTSSSPRHIFHHWGPMPVQTNANLGAVGTDAACGDLPAVGEGLKLFSHIGNAVGDHGVAMVQMSAPLAERVAQIRQRDIGVRWQDARPADRPSRPVPPRCAPRSAAVGQPATPARSIADAGARAGAGGSASTTWALVPPNPNEFTPAMRRSQSGNGRPVAGMSIFKSARET